MCRSDDSQIHSVIGIVHTVSKMSWGCGTCMLLSGSQQGPHAQRHAGCVVIAIRWSETRSSFLQGDTRSHAKNHSVAWSRAGRLHDSMEEQKMLQCTFQPDMSRSSSMQLRPGVIQDIHGCHDNGGLRGLLGWVLRT